MLILLCSTTSPAVSKIATIVREAFAATPLGIVVKAVRENRGSRTPAGRSVAVTPTRMSR